MRGCTPPPSNPAGHAGEADTRCFTSVTAGRGQQQRDLQATGKAREASKTKKRRKKKKRKTNNKKRWQQSQPRAYRIGHPDRGQVVVSAGKDALKHRLDTAVAQRVVPQFLAHVLAGRKERKRGRRGGNRFGEGGYHQHFSNRQVKKSTQGIANTPPQSYSQHGFPERRTAGKARAQWWATSRPPWPSNTPKNASLADRN